MAIHPPVKALPLDKCGVLITGGTSAAGLATAMQFATAGVRRIALIGRDESRGQAAREAVLAQTPDAQIEFIVADANQVARITAQTISVKRGISAG